MTPRSTSSAAEHRSEDAADPDQTDRPAKTSSAGQHAKRARPKPSDGAAADAGAAPRRVSPGGLDKMRLTGDRLMVRMPEDRERRSKAGLLIPATAAATHKRCIWSDVVLVGPDTRSVRTGDLVLFIPQSGVEVEVDAETFLLLRERDVQAVASERVDPHAGQYL
jgi:chaperonin GroES